MVKIIEINQQFGNVSNYQSRIVKFNSFTEYLMNLNEQSLSPNFLEVYEKFVDYEKEIVTFMFEKKVNKKWIEFTHFAQVIG